MNSTIFLLFVCILFPFLSCTRHKTIDRQTKSKTWNFSFKVFLFYFSLELCLTWSVFLKWSKNDRMEELTIKLFDFVTIFVKFFQMEILCNFLKWFSRDIFVFFLKERDDRNFFIVEGKFMIDFFSCRIILP